ncbi:MAG TPA: EscU/YscU/HrcU family type III secretion system export apparatus switch protein [Spirochaetia bacterium]|nr:EscU/YscU/HrcU family type III secretion system export apparatus switch protein [Spirochaetia bacterium]
MAPRPKPKPMAVALKYEAGLRAPFLLAKGSGKAAGRLEALARESGVPLLRDGALAEALYPIDLGDYVPEEYYETVARVFAFVKKIEEA